MVVERPIPYGQPMVRARRAGLKTNTRRVVKPVGGDDSFVLQDYGNGWWPYRSDDGESPMKGDNEIPLACPYGKPGDRLWVREAYRTLAHYDALPPRDVPRDAPLWFEADGPAPAEFGRYRHAKFMCRWMSRGLDEVVSVRVERLQDISKADALAEGIREQTTTGWFSVPGVDGAGTTARAAYALLWNSINGAGSWDANAWVWVVTFKVLH